MSRVSIVKITLCCLLIIINGCISASSSESLPESDHPYSNNFVDTWTISEPGASQIRLHFEYIQLAKDENFGSCDELCILDRYGNIVETYGSRSGVNYQDFWTNWYEGDTLQVKLVTDDSRICDGFVVDKTDLKLDESITSDSSVESNSLAESDHPYENNYEDAWAIKESGAAQIRLHFKYLKLAKDENFGSCDKLCILDRYGNIVETYGSRSGVNYQDFWTNWYEGDTLQVKLVTDDSRICDGFVVDKTDLKLDESIASDPETAESEVQSPSDDTRTGGTNILTATELTYSASPSAFGQSVTFVAKVDTPSPETEKPLGTVTFMDGTEFMGTADVTSGQATLTTSSLSSGPHSITAKYSGDNNFESSKSPAFTLTVLEPPEAIDPGINDPETSTDSHEKNPIIIVNNNTQVQNNVQTETSIDSHEKNSLVRDIFVTVTGGLVVTLVGIIIQKKYLS